MGTDKSEMSEVIQLLQHVRETFFLQDGDWEGIWLYQNDLVCDTKNDRQPTPHAAHPSLSPAPQHDSSLRTNALTFSKLHIPGILGGLHQDPDETPVHLLALSVADVHAEGVAEGPGAGDVERAILGLPANGTGCSGRPTGKLCEVEVQESLLFGGAFVPFSDVCPARTGPVRKASRQ